MARAAYHDSIPGQAPQTLSINPQVEIPLGELNFRFSRSGGKGGQNVNKVETKVELLFDVGNSPSITDEQRALALSKLDNRLDADGVLHIVAQSSRSQWKNREEAIGRFIETMRQALTPVKKRKKIKVSRESKEKRLQQKKRRGEIKKMRRTTE